MTITDRKRLRHDVLKIVQERQTFQIQGIAEYVRCPENQEFDFRVLWKKVMAGNARFFENQGSDEALARLLSREEMLWLARLHRFTSYFVSEAIQQIRPLSKEVSIETTTMDGVSAEWQTVESSNQNRVLMYIHGGGWILDSPFTHRPLTAAIATSAKVSVLSVDYRLAPENPFPAHLEDCVTCYKGLLANGVSPSNILIGGDSAGGNLTLATLLYLRDHCIPLPAGALALSPSTDLAHAGVSYFANGATDPILADSGVFWWGPAYAGGTDFSNPMISPICADLGGLPPLLVQVSKSEMLYSECRRFAEKAEKANVDVTLEAWDDMPHVFQQFGLHSLKEAREALEGIRVFIQRVME
jgi:monoterpene epsilon-lactone hydrolase